MMRHSSLIYLLKKRKRFRAITGLLVCSIIFLVTKWLQSYTEWLLGQAVVAIVSQETRGRYDVRYADLQFDVWRNKLQLSELDIFPHACDSVLPVTNQYALRVKSVSLETESVWQIYFTKELKIIGLTLIKPEIRVENFADAAQKSATFSRQTGNLYLLIRNYLNKFQIKHFAMYQASLDFVHHGKLRMSNYQLQHVNFALQNLVIDSASAYNNKKIFYADGFDLSIGGQEIMLPDSLHVFTFDKLEISTQKASITFRNFRLLPRRDLPNYENIYRMSVPELSFQGVNFASAYNDNKLLINKLAIMQPDITIEQAIKKKYPIKRSEWQADRTFLKILAAIFDSVAVKKFQIVKGAFALKEGGNPKLLLPQLEFSLDSFAFAVPDTSETARFPTLRNADLTLYNQRFLIGDSLYLIQLRYLRLTSHPAEVRASGVTFCEWQGGAFRRRMAADSLAAGWHHWEQLTVKEPLHFQYIRLMQPVVRLQMPAESQEKLTSLLHKKREIKAALIDELRIDKGEIEWSNQSGRLHLKKCNWQMKKLALADNPVLWAAQLPLATAVLSIGETIWQDDRHKLQVGLMRLQTHRGKLQVAGSNLTIEPQKTDDDAFALTGSMRQFAIKNLIIKNLLEDKQAVFDSLRLTGASLQLQLKKAGLAEVPSPRLIGAVVAQQSEILVRRNAWEFAKMWGVNGWFLFQADLLPLIFQQAAGMQITWGGYRLSATHPQIDSRNRMLELHQLKLEATHSDSAELSLQKLIAKGWDIDAWNYNKCLKFNDLHIDKLSGHFIGRPSQAGKIAFDSLHIDTLTVASDSFKLDLSSNSFRVQQLYTQLAGFRWNPSVVALRQINAFHTRRAALQLQPVEVRFSDAYLADTAAQLLTLNNLQIIHKDLDGQFQQASLSLPDKKWLRHCPPAVGEIVLADGKIYLHPDSVQQAFSPNTHLHINRLDVQRTRLQGEKLSANVHLLRVEQLSDDKQPLVHAHLGNLRWLLPNQRDLLEISALFYEPATQHLQLDSVRLSPALSVDEFYQRYPVQQSYNTYFVNRIAIYAPQWRKLINGGGFAAASARLNNIYGDIFLDRNMQRFKEARIFPLEKFKQMKLSVQIDTVKFFNGIISYREKTRRNETASFSLQKISGYMYGLNNRPTAKDSVYLRMNAAPEGRGEIDADIYFAIGNNRGQHRIEATFDTIPLFVFNRLTEPLAGIRISQGQIKGGSMQVEANVDMASGKMWMYYNNLKFRVLSRKITEQDEVIRKSSPLLTMLANTLIRNKNKRIKLYKGKTGYIAQSRDPDKSLFAYWGRIVVNGALSSIGISQRTQAKWRQRMRERAERQD